MGYTVMDVLKALYIVSRGRVVLEVKDLLYVNNPCVVTKTSHIPGKAVTELPGLVYGDLNDPVGKIGLAMTLTENVIEIAQPLGINVLVIHHPLADAASSGGVTLGDYLKLYGLSVFELHEAFHGTHPGVSYLHGFAATTMASSGFVNWNRSHAPDSTTVTAWKGLAAERKKTGRSRSPLPRTTSPSCTTQ